MSLALPSLSERRAPSRAKRAEPPMPSTGSVVRRARTRLGKGRRSPSFLEAALVAQHIHQLRAAAVFLPIPVILAGFGETYID